jgi:hypothetical protein
MGELLDKPSALDDCGPAAEPINPLDRVASAFRSASHRVNKAIDAVQESVLTLVDRLSCWTRQARSCRHS